MRGFTDNRQHIRHQIQQDIGGGENHAGSLYHRQITACNRVHQQLPKSRIDEHHLDHDDTDNQIGQIDNDDIDDGREGVGKRVADNDTRARHAL